VTEAVATETRVTASDLATSLVLPAPPSDDERRAYLHRNLPLIVIASFISLGTLLVSQLHFVLLNGWLLILTPFIGFTVVYFLLSLRVNATRKPFDFETHEALVASWAPKRYPGVDILSPICNEPIPVLNNTWTYVAVLASHYRGNVEVYVLDDGANAQARDLAEGFGFHYSVREDRGYLKKAGNLRHGYRSSSGDFLAIFDADFAPRHDFLDELLPYMYADDKLGIVQSPQFFRGDGRQTSMERGGGAVQEFFYRVVQTSRDRLNGAICVGSCALYRRAALDAIGGTALIEHSEDVHTGFDLAQAGWALRYIPLPLAAGMSPTEGDSFLTQQYRWCSGSMSLMRSHKFWNANLPLSTRLCYMSGFCYYIHTAVFSIVGPLIPLILIVGLPNQVHPRNFFWIIPATIFALVVFPLWHEGRYGPSALMAKHLYGWAHAFAILDMVRGKTMGWQATGGGKKMRVTRMWMVITTWGVLVSVVWVGGSIARMFQYGALSFVFLLATGLVYAVIVLMAISSRQRRAAAVPVSIG
jgi:cellulose synthase (UDP-forming)